MSKDEPGIVRCFASLDDKPTIVSIFKKNTETNISPVLPDVVEPKGFTKQRAEYLRKEIRQFCRPGTEDLVAP